MVKLNDIDTENPWTEFWVAVMFSVILGYFITWILVIPSFLILGFEYTSVLYENLFGNISVHFRVDYRVHTLGEKVYMILLSFLHGMLVSPIRNMLFSSIRGIIKKNLS